MRSLHRRTVLALAGLAATVLVVGAGTSPNPRAAAAALPIETSANGEYLIQFAKGAAQRVITSRGLHA
ncbi:MAG: hypothetical protein WCC60_03640, partial [Ilumatobacteraceae bacterium]